MYIYVIKSIHDGEESIIGFSHFFSQAKSLAESNCPKGRHWIIERWPVGRRVSPYDRKEARDMDILAGEKPIPAGTLYGPYDGFVTNSRIY